jgi:hypothetical protein
MVDQPIPSPKLPGDISSTDRIVQMAPVGSESKEMGLPMQSFSSFMQGSQASPMLAAGKATMISPFDLAHGQPMLAQAPTFATLVAQVNSAQSTMGDLSQQLSYPNLKLKASQKYLLKNKLTDANANLRIANLKMGANVPDAPDMSQFTGPLGKFIGYLSDGQSQLEAAKQQLQSLKDKGAHLTPGDFLLIQVKMNKAQQELEFSSVLLSNAVQDFKMMMQVQL